MQTVTRVARQLSPAWLTFALLLTTLANTVLHGSLAGVIASAVAVTLFTLNVINAVRRAAEQNRG